MTDTAVNESGDRADFLGTVRRAVSQPHRAHTRPITALPATTPPVTYANAPTGNLTEAFTSALSALGGNVRTVIDLNEFLDDVFAAHPSASRVVLSDDPECEPLRELLAEREDIEILAFDNPSTVATADIGFTGARAAVAHTGSIVVDSGRAGGRSVSLLPPVHVALVHEEAIVATPGDHWRTLVEPMPSNLVQITGPSRSADIELIITLGVHGPRELWVGVLSPAPDPDVPIA